MSSQTSNLTSSSVPEDLTIALQNLGSRVRKSKIFEYIEGPSDAFDTLLGVTEGYNTHQLLTFPVPPTPCSSPAKLPSTQTTPTPIFRSANDTFNSIFPPGCIRVPLTPSPKKRRRQEELEGESQIRDNDVEMEPESEIDDDQVRVILGPDATSNLLSLPRKIKPLRRSMAQNRGDTVIPHPSSLTTQDVGISLDMVQGEGGEMDFSEEAVN